MVARSEVNQTSLDPTVGSEIQKTRPCVVVSPAEMHDGLHTIIVAPMTTGSHPVSFRIPVSLNGKDGLILIDQIYTLNKVRLIKKVGAVDAKVLSAALDVLQEAFAEQHTEKYKFQKFILSNRKSYFITVINHEIQIPLISHH